MRMLTTKLRLRSLLLRALLGRMIRQQHPGNSPSLLPLLLRRLGWVV
jgi:hypothetical protein